MSPLFLVLEGPDGSGTTTQSRLLAERLKKEGYAVTLTAEPTSGTVGKWIREHLQNGTTLSPAAFQLLFCADRAQHLEEVIKPALARGEIVVCDRYALSTIVYGEAQGLPSSWLAEVNKNFIQPDVLVIALPPFEVAFKRVQKRANAELFETEAMQRMIHDGYHRYASEHPATKTIDTSGSVEESASQIWSIVREYL